MKTSRRRAEQATVMLVAGARPNFMKIAPVQQALAAANVRTIIVHTGQHYDERMSAAFFRDLKIGEPNHYLGVGSASHAVQTARIMEAFEPVLLSERPDWVLVPGDVNSTLACALVCVKLKAETGTRLAHLEAGLRSNDWRMPEEVNRVLSDRCADLLLTPSRDAEANLAREGIDPKRVAFVGNVMIDTLLSLLPRAREMGVCARMKLTPGKFVLATLHRPSNVDHRDVLEVCLSALAAIAKTQPVVLPLHPRTSKQVETFGLKSLLEGLTITEPLPYLEMLSLLDGAACALTDSGGIQEETTALGVPCVTLREQTERPITVEEGTNRLAPWPLTVDGILTTYQKAMKQGRAEVGARCPDGWDGRAAERTVKAMFR